MLFLPTYLTWDELHPSILVKSVMRVYALVFIILVYPFSYLILWQLLICLLFCWFFSFSCETRKKLPWQVLLASYTVTLLKAVPSLFSPILRIQWKLGIVLIGRKIISHSTACWFISTQCVVVCHSARCSHVFISWINFKKLIMMYTEQISTIFSNH